MIPRTWWWILAAAGLVLMILLRKAARRAIRRWAWRHALRTRRALGFRLNPVTLTRKQRLTREMLADADLRARVADLARETGRDEASLLADASLYLDEIIPNFNLLTTYTFGKRLAGWLLRSCYRVRIGRSAEVALNRIPRDASVVYVMNHRSNADYLLVAFLLSNRVSISYAVGEWARVWPLERLFRSFGSFFVRRRFRDPLYHAVLERYVQRAVAQGTTQGIFIEGGLSKDGRLQAPKLGLLDYMLRAGAKDLVFIPVGINYDRVLEDSNLVRESLGQPRRSPLALLRRTSLWLLGLAWRGATRRFHRFGYAVANFGQPIHAKAALEGVDLRSLDWEARHPLLEAVADSLLRAVGAEVPIPPVAAVAWVYRSMDNPAPGRAQLRDRMVEVLAAAQERGLPLYLPRGSYQRAFEVGLRVLLLRRILVLEEGHLILPAPKAPLLDYYAHGVAHLLDRAWAREA
ncbi:glycerol-3-phosphate 1-O-acyltransferase [Geothrix limicola]|uniref:Glycerol-3-phosphate acyltransferase n=1 Tax=Geothrix limicola TaxID=2927978 RepID=A0ABQ5QHG8_9BACT|nr:1-acyl-sn-glycerol-3-phosphate acyltransferase [Geothrix limicola]GLH73781.1 glycerol-3-phosphate 1-O-acyltransferase [Geothrix limicola]